MRSFNSLCTVLASAATVSAHGWIDTLHIDNQDYTGYNPTVAPWVPDQGTVSWPSWNTDLGPVFSNAVNNPDVICSINATNSKKAPAPVPAGSIVDLHWTKWPESHHGPIISYLAACNGDCATVDKTTLKFFKIAEMGQLELGAGGGTSGKWAADVLIEADGAWNVTIPQSIKSGNYVLRNEIIALHSAYNVGGAQLYPTCISIAVSGGGEATPEGVLGTELYDKEGSGFHYNIYNDESKPVYKIPGPALCKLISSRTRNREIDADSSTKMKARVLERALNVLGGIETLTSQSCNSGQSRPTSYQWNSRGIKFKMTEHFLCSIDRVELE
jgi:hypothetical protein